MADLVAFVRNSDFRDNSASPQQQRQVIADYAAAQQHRIIAWVDDDDISGDYGPFHPARKTAAWLSNTPPQPNDGFVTRAIDRVARNAEQVLRLLRWAAYRGKNIISVKDGVDTATEAGKIQAKFMAIVAEMELDRIKQRARGSYRYLTQVAMRYPGGQVPFGYMPVCALCGSIRQECRCPETARTGWKLAADPVYAPVLREMIARVTDDREPWSLGQVARWLNQGGIPAPRDIVRIRNGRKPAGSAWTAPSVRKILMSKAMLGAVEVTEPAGRDDETGKVTRRSERKAVYDADGNLLLRAEPLVSYETWARVQAILAKNPGRGHPHARTSGLLKVAYCGICRSPLYASGTRYKDTVYRYYCCASSSAVSRNAGIPGRCPARRFPAGDLEREITAAILAEAGSRPYRVPRIIPAEEYSAPLAQVRDAVNNLVELAESGAFSGRAELFRQRMAALDARRAALEARPSRPARTTWEDSGMTIAEKWASMPRGTDPFRFLRDAGVKVYVTRDGSMPALAASGPMTAADIPHVIVRRYADVTLSVDLGPLGPLADALCRALTRQPDHKTGQSTSGLARHPAVTPSPHGGLHDHRTVIRA